MYGLGLNDLGLFLDLKKQTVVVTVLMVVLVCEAGVVRRWPRQKQSVI